VNEPEPTRPPGPDPLAGKTAEEQWAWAVAIIPELGALTAAPETVDFHKLNLRNRRVTLHAPNLTLHWNEKQPPPCLPLPFTQEGGLLVTRVSLDGRNAKPDLADNYAIVRLGVTFDDHDAKIGGTGQAYAAPDRDAVLSEVGDGVLRYDGRPALYAVACATHQETRACSDGTKRVCRWCKPFLVEVPDPDGGAWSTAHRETCEPCPPDEGSHEVPALNRVMTGRRFLQVTPGSGPSFYTSQAACRKAVTSK
jgi:hypothetical protein